jgi:adenosine deaminase
MFRTDDGAARLDAFIEHMPKVELHVHLEGAVAPETLLLLAGRHGIALPATTPESLRDWYRFTDFRHFVEVYLRIASCLRTVDDIELIAREFFSRQAEQNIVYSEVTYTAYTQYLKNGLPFRDQLAALNRARAWAEREHGVQARFIIDIPRVISAEDAMMVASWAIDAMGDGVVALGLGGPEADNPPERYARAFERAKAAGLARVPHAGETAGPDSIWGALRALAADRIGHGVRALEDDALVEELRSRRMPLEVCPTSNVCLHVAPSLPAHPLPRLINAGLCVTVNSDDPSLFNTDLTAEFRHVAHHFGFGEAALQRLVGNALDAALLPPAERARLAVDLQTQFARLRGAPATATPV